MISPTICPPPPPSTEWVHFIKALYLVYASTVVALGANKMLICHDLSSGNVTVLILFYLLFFRNVVCDKHINLGRFSLIH